MSLPRYKIVFDGTLMPDMSIDAVKANLASLFKSDIARIEGLFGRGPVAIKRDLAEAEADKYLHALQRAGARVRKEADLTAALSLVETDEEKAARTNEEEQAQQVLQPMECPKCGHRQDKAAECGACGIVIDKYLARQAAIATSPAIQPSTASVASTSSTPYTPPRANIDVHEGEVGELKVFSFSGRIGRMRYLAWSLVMMFVFIGVTAGLAALSAGSPGFGGFIIIAATVALLVVSVQIGVQRLHDMGWSGWFWLLNLVPVINSVFWIIMLVVPGSVASNRYGPPPPPNSLAVNLLGGILLVVLVGSLLVLFLSGIASLAMFSVLFGQFLGGV